MDQHETAVFSFADTRTKSSKSSTFVSALQSQMYDEYVKLDIAMTLLPPSKKVPQQNKIEMQNSFVSYYSYTSLLSMVIHS